MYSCITNKKEPQMNAYEIESSIAEGQEFCERLFDFVRKNAEEQEAHEMEAAIFKKLIPIGQAAMKAYFAERGTGDIGKEIQREDGEILKRESVLRSRQYTSIFGAFPVPRTCYRMAGEPGVFPLDEAVNLPERCYSYYLQEWMNLLSIDHPFAEGADRLNHWFGFSLVESTMVSVSRDGDRNYDEYYEQKTPPAAEEEGEMLVLSFDGKGVPMIKSEAAQIQAKLGKGEKRQKKKEALVGVSYSVDKKERSADELAERLVKPEEYRARREEKKNEEDEPKGRNIRRMASVKRAKVDVMTEMKKDVERRDPRQIKPLVILLDGALGLWSLVIHLMMDWKGPVTYILDIIHVRDYLWDAANALHEEESAAGRVWVQEKLEQILKGGVGYVIGGLKQTITKRGLKGNKRKALEKAIKYFERHKKWMAYDQYLAAGMPVATGMVESACSSVVKKRMEGEGKRWSVDGAEAILLLRSLQKSNDFITYWRFHAIQERKRLYESQLNYAPILHLALAA